MKKLVSGMMLTILMLGTLTLTLNVQPAKSSPTIITVPDDYTTIQAAINAANSRDTIYVRNGFYSEHIDLDKTVTLEGESNQNTIIEAHVGVYHFGVDITASNTIIENLRIVPPNSTKPLEIPTLVCIDGQTAPCSNDTVRNCVFVFATFVGANSDAIDVLNSANNTVTGNLITIADPTDAGIAVVLGSVGNLVDSNTVTGGWISIAIDSADNNTVSNNYITGQRPQGEQSGAVYLGLTSGDTVKGNTLANNTIAIMLSRQVYNCLIFNNNFMENTQQALIDSTATLIAWDNGYPSGGNYWSDYVGVDVMNGPNQDLSGSDGIGDTPYTIDMNNKDHYPLMNPNAGPPLSVSVTPCCLLMYAGQSQLFDSTVTGGSPPYTYQWFLRTVAGHWNWTPISGATNPILNFTARSALDYFDVAAVVTDSAGTQTRDIAKVWEPVFGAPVYFTVEPVPAAPLTDVNASINGLETPPTPSPVGENFTAEIHLRNATTTNVPLGVEGVEVHFDLRSISDYCTPIGFTNELGQTGGALVEPLIYGLNPGFYDDNWNLISNPPYTNATLYMVAAAGHSWWGDDGLVAKITFQITGQPSQQMGQPDFYAPLQLVYGELADTLANDILPLSVAQGTLRIDGTRMSPALPGDLNGDGIVSLVDLQLLANAYNSKPGDPSWNPLADIASPYEIISLTDLVTMAMHYGQHNP